MTGFTDKNGILHADNVSLAKVAQEVGTPCYVYAASSIRTQFEHLAGAMRKALPQDNQPLICYACKASSNIAILSLIRQMGGGLETVSEGEMRRGAKAKFDSKKIVSTGVGKTDNEIELGLQMGILQFNIESLPELERINAIAGKIGKMAEVAFRLNPNVSGGGHHKISTGRSHDKFGLSAADIFNAYAMAKAMKHVKAIGLSMHIGSQVFDVEKFKHAFDKLPALVKDLRAKEFTVARLDIGGGFPIRYNDEELLDLNSYAQWVRDIILPLEAEIILEPGRYLVGNAGVVLTRVRDVKESDGRSFLILDAAMNDLMRPALYDAYHGIEPVENRHAPIHICDIVGPVCETGDTFCTDRKIPSMKAGDLAVIKSAGAYGASMASNYNTRPLLAEVLADGGRYAIIRRRQTYEDILDRDIVPDWL